MEVKEERGRIGVVMCSHHHHVHENSSFNESRIQRSQSCAAQVSSSLPYGRGVGEKDVMAAIHFHGLFVFCSRDQRNGGANAVAAVRAAEGKLHQKKPKRSSSRKEEARLFGQ